MKRVPWAWMISAWSATLLFAAFGPTWAQAEADKNATAGPACPCPSCSGDPSAPGQSQAESKAGGPCPQTAKGCCRGPAADGAKAKACCKVDPRPADAPTELQKPVAKPMKLTDIDQLKTAFNKDLGTPRMVLLLSTTCPVCVDGARRVQKEILAKHPQARLKLYVVWEPMLPTDALRTARQDLIPDPRALHFKDPQRLSGRWFASHMKECPSLGQIAWDAFYLFDGQATWDARPAPTLACGTPVVRAWETLSKAVVPLLEEEEVSRGQ